MKRYERIAGLLLIAVGLAAAGYALLILKLGTARRPGSGFMPFIASLTLVVFSAIWVLGSLRDGASGTFWGAGAWRRPALALLLMVCYAVAIEQLGYHLSTLSFMLAWQLLVERERLVKASLISVLSTAGMYLLFGRLLGVPVPAGVLAL